jgi:hypothetical protein
VSCLALDGELVDFLALRTNELVQGEVGQRTAIHLDNNVTNPQ